MELKHLCTLATLACAFAASAVEAPRALIVPAETEDIAIAIANGKASSATSRYVRVVSDSWTSEATSVPGGCSADGTCRMPREVTRFTATFKRPWRWYFRRTTLRFAGAACAFGVRVNGKEAGRAEADFLPSEFDVSPFLKWFGLNTIEVEVDGKASADLFREVILLSESKSAPRDLIAETWLADAFSAAKFTIRDEKGAALKVRDVPGPRLWSPEAPCVYVTPIEHKWGWWIFGGTDYYTVAFGFRKLEQRAGVLLLNGRRAQFKGVCDHGIKGETAFVQTVEEMKKDLKLLQSFNVNAAYVGSRLEDPAWFDLCDREGLMFVCETSSANKTRLLGYYRNHPSIVIWSAGEANGGVPASQGGFVKEGLFDAARRPLPGAKAVKHAYQPADVLSFDWKTGVAVLANGYMFNDLGDLSLLITREKKDGKILEKKWVDFEDFEAGTTREVTIDPKDAEVVAFRFKDGMEDAAWATFVKPGAKPIEKKGL